MSIGHSSRPRVNRHSVSARARRRNDARVTRSTISIGVIENPSATKNIDSREDRFLVNGYHGVVWSSPRRLKNTTMCTPTAGRTNAAVEAMMRPMNATENPAGAVLVAISPVIAVSAPIAAKICHPTTRSRRSWVSTSTTSLVVTTAWAAHELMTRWLRYPTANTNAPITSGRVESFRPGGAGAESEDQRQEEVER